MAALRDTIRLAFVAALQHLPPRQRAVLILRDVLCWSVAEVAGLLGTTAASVNSALQRARATIAARDVTAADPYRPMDRAQRDLLARYVEAFTSYDVDSLVALLREDAVMTMPPFAWWLRGRSDIRAALVGSAGACRGDRLVPTVANGTPAFGQYRDGSPFALLVVEIVGGRVGATTTYLDPGRLFPLFALPDRLPMSFADPTRRSRYDDDH